MFTIWNFSRADYESVLIFALSCQEKRYFHNYVFIFVLRILNNTRCCLSRNLVNK